MVLLFCISKEKAFIVFLVGLAQAVWLEAAKWLHGVVNKMIYSINLQPSVSTISVISISVFSALMYCDDRLSLTLTSMIESIDRFKLVDLTLFSNTSYSLLQDTVIAVLGKRMPPSFSAIFTTITVVIKDKVQNSAYFEDSVLFNQCLF